MLREDIEQHAATARLSDMVGAAHVEGNTSQICWLDEIIGGYFSQGDEVASKRHHATSSLSPPGRGHRFGTTLLGPTILERLIRFDRPDLASSESDPTGTDDLGFRSMFRFLYTTDFV
jgi:hypothetical protein